MKVVPQTDAERLTKVMDELGINAYGLSKALDYKEPTTVYHIVKGRQGMSLKFMERLIKKYPHISYLYLKDGTGDLKLDHKGMIAQNNLLGIDSPEQTKEDLILESLEDLHGKVDLIMKHLKL